MKNLGKEGEQKMRMRKTLLVTVLSVVLLLLSIMPTSALPQITTLQQKAEFLDELSILAGANGSYMLDEKLRRSEAAAFAVRLLGKEYHVLVSSASYKQTKYPDVDPNLWFASYIGYCTNEGILSGDTSGNFNPNDFITEKSFIKIILGVLGHEMNVDYTWDNVYKKAYEIGLVHDLTYISKIDDNMDYKRSEAINIMYNALTLKTKITKRELFYNLIDSSIITEEEAINLGLIEATQDKEGFEKDGEENEQEEPIEDDIVTEIADINVFDETSISIHFNEGIKGIKQIKIYESYNSKKLLGYQIDTIEDNYIFIRTDTQTPGVEYKIELTGIEDLVGNVEESLTTTFMSHTLGNIESNFFRINKIEPINEKSIKVYFTHPINMNIENPLYYTIHSGRDVFANGEDNELLVRIYSTDTNCVLLTLNNKTFTEDYEYTIEIDGRMRSAYGVNLNDGEGDVMGFKAKSGKEERFKLDQIIPYDESTLMLVFNKEINPFLAQQIYNFYITNEEGTPVSIVKTTTETSYDTSGEVLFISINGRFRRDDLYYITINNLNDITRQEYISEITYSFEADYDEREKLQIDYIDSINNQMLEVYFSMPLDEESALDENNYNISRRSSSRIYPKVAYYDRNEDPYKVVLYLSDSDKLVGNREYTLQISKKFKDHMGNITTQYLEEDFTAVPRSKGGLSIDSVVPISTNAVKIAFDEPIAFNITNLSPDNYSLEYNLTGMSIKESPVSVMYYNSKTLILKFNDMFYDMPYAIKFNTITDYFDTVYKVTNEGVNYVEFIISDD